MVPSSFYSSAGFDVILLMQPIKWLFLVPSSSAIYFPTATVEVVLNIISVVLFTFVIIYCVFKNMHASFERSNCAWSRSLFVMIPYRLSTLKMVELNMFETAIRMPSSILFR